MHDVVVEHPRALVEDVERQRVSLGQVLEDDGVEEGPVRVAAVVVQELRGVLPRDGQPQDFCIDGGAVLLEQFHEAGGIVVEQLLDLGERDAEALQLLNHVDGGALIVRVVPVPRLLVDAHGFQQPHLVVQPQRLLGDAVKLGHRAGWQIVHASPLPLKHPLFYSKKP